MVALRVVMTGSCAADYRVTLAVGYLAHGMWLGPYSG